LKRSVGSLEHEEINYSGSLDDFEIVTGVTTDRNLESTIGGLLEHEEISLSGNLDDFVEESHSPVRNFVIALEDTVETIIGGTTVRNLVGKTQPTVDWVKSSKDNEFSITSANAGRGVAELLVDPISQGSRP